MDIKRLILMAMMGGQLSIQEAVYIIEEYIFEKKQVTYRLSQNDMFNINQLMPFAIEYFQKKFNVLMVHNKEGLLIRVQTDDIKLINKNNHLSY